MKKFSEKITHIASLILPTYCQNCTQYITEKNYLYYCKDCISYLRTLFDPLELYREGMSDTIRFWSIIDYHKLKGEFFTITDIKVYNKSFLLHKVLSLIKDVSFLPSVDDIIYVPLSLRRYLERGFNPSFIIAKHISNLIDIKISKGLLKKDGIPQSSYNREGRFKNMENNIFTIKKNYCIPKKDEVTLLIVDDIITTGATLYSIANLLKQQYSSLQLNIIGFGLFHSEV